MSEWTENLLGLLIIIGAIFTLVGSIGLYKLPDFYMRLHGPTKASTLGVGAILIASVIYFSIKQDALSLHEILVTLFLFITAPIGAHLMAKSAIHINTEQVSRTKKYHSKNGTK
ncbi:Na+/H+ antiporter subunit G [Thiomicrorhabdus lithotrophica]|uniref:Na+/H+ antiporter subunit G n=1 Tax=Thiomicrorhabdus lithotrophica TaxID=2949997 RepID=A0ABY8CF18_9GAMM|nr:Na+/H+ antiporter subunit G [Thiomicrorhabdus lithotrophica]WEJ62703.1 Na+/H+ antiporter subunit G [Thiomicrorhabdus lithotrophica]